jgi:23S rRNA pseudouridine955/2504/2580 synthase
MSAVESITIDEDEGDVRVDRWFRRRWPHLSQGQIEKLLRTGQVRVDGARVKANDRLQVGQIVRVPPIPAPVERAASTGAISPRDAEFVQSLVLYRDTDIIVINKPHGLAVQGGTKTVRHLDGLLEGLRFDADAKPKLVHRLDRDTSGCLVLARTAKAAASLGALFRSRGALQKIYWALVVGAPRPEAGQIRGWMRKAPGSVDSDREMMQRCLQKDEGAVFAVSDYATIDNAGGRAAWMALRPETGRTHQLRFHMAEIGHAIIGDPKYKCDRVAPEGLSGKLHLHARALELPSAKGKPLRIIAPLPEHFEASFDTLGFDAREAKDPFAAFAS